MLAQGAQGLVGFGHGKDVLYRMGLPRAYRFGGMNWWPKWLPLSGVVALLALVLFASLVFDIAVADMTGDTRYSPPPPPKGWLLIGA